MTVSLETLKRMTVADLDWLHVSVNDPLMTCYKAVKHVVVVKWVNADLLKFGPRASSMRYRNVARNS